MDGKGGGLRTAALCAYGPSRRLLFNLSEDPGEQHDIAASDPDIVADLAKVAAHKAG
jgi:hypothetical protein